MHPYSAFLADELLPQVDHSGLRALDVFAGLADELLPQVDHSGLRALDVFAGAGGLTIGLKAAGIRTVACVEIEPYWVATFMRHTPKITAITSDIRRVNFLPYRGGIDIVYGGPPCQPFSTGGLRKAASDQQNIIPDFLRTVEEISPSAVLMENVPGLVSGDRFAILSGVLEQLEEFGYTVTWKVINAADYGVPQKRRRLIVVGLRDRVFEFPKETHGPGRTKPHVVVHDALPSEPIGQLNPSKVFFAKRPDIRLSPYDGHVFNGGGHPINMIEPCHTILASAGGNKTHFFDTEGLAPNGFWGSGC